MTLEQLANDLYANHREAEALELCRVLKDAERYQKAKELGYIREHYEREIDIAIYAAREDT